MPNEKKTVEKTVPVTAAKPRMGQPPANEATKKSIEVTIEDDFVVIKVPRKDLTKRLLADILN